MAEEFVRIGQFEESLRRIDERFLGIEKVMEQGFAHAAKEREHILVHMNQRFDDMNQRFDDMNHRFDDMNRGMNQRFDDMNHRFDDMNRGINERFDSLDKRLDDQRKIVSVLLTAIVTTMAVGAAAGVGAALKYIFS